MSRMLIVSLLMILSVAVVASAQTPASAPAGGFTNVTKESGVDDIVSTHYKNVPKWWLSGMDLIDIDSDGHLDLFLGAHGQESAAARGDGKGNFKYVEPKLEDRKGDLPYPGSEEMIAFDFNEDGLLDMAVTYFDGGAQWWTNLSKPDAWLFKPTKYSFGGCRMNAVADLDRDGKADWITSAGERGGGFRLFRGNGDGTFAEPTRIDGAVGKFIDLNGDGFLDIVVSNGGYEKKEGECYIYINDGKMKFTDKTEECGLKSDGTVINVVGDLNGDGFPDLICLEEHHTKFNVYLNDGKGHFTKKEDALIGLGKARKPSDADWGQGIVTDFDNDGIPDIIMNGKHFLYVLRGNADGTFEYINKKWGISEFATAAVNEGLCFGDINEDGMLDIITCGGDMDKNKRVNVFRNDLPKQNWVRVRPVGAKGNRGAAGAIIRVFDPAAGDKAAKPFWTEQVVFWGRQSCHSYYQTPITERHFGLGKRDKVNVEVEFYPSGKHVEAQSVAANRIVTIEEESGKNSATELGKATSAPAR